MDVSKLKIAYMDGFVGIPKPNGFVQKDKVLPYMTIVFPQRGYYDISLEDGPFQRLEEGEGCYITRPFQRHTIVHWAAPGEETMQPLWLRLSVEYADGPDATGWFRPPLFVTGEGAKVFESAIKELSLQKDNLAKYSQLYTGADSPRQVFRKLRLAGQVLEGLLDICPIDLPSADMDRLLPALTLVREHYHSPLRVEDLAKACELSPSTLHRLFKQHLGKTPQSYLHQWRLAQAARMLTTHMTLRCIAQQCGFCDEFHLSRSFKQHYGVSPRIYRSGAAE